MPRITVNLSDEAAAALVELAGGARKQSEYLNRQLLSTSRANRRTGTNTLATLQYQVNGMVNELEQLKMRVQNHEHRLIRLEPPGDDDIPF